MIWIIRIQRRYVSFRNVCVRSEIVFFYDYSISKRIIYTTTGKNLFEVYHKNNFKGREVCIPINENNS